MQYSCGKINSILYEASLFGSLVPPPILCKHTQEILYILSTITFIIPAHPVIFIYKSIVNLSFNNLTDKIYMHPTVYIFVTLSILLIKFNGQFIRSDNIIIIKPAGL